MFEIVPIESLNAVINDAANKSLHCKRCGSQSISVNIECDFRNRFVPGVIFPFVEDTGKRTLTIACGDCQQRITMIGQIEPSFHGITEAHEEAASRMRDAFARFLHDDDYDTEE